MGGQGEVNQLRRSECFTKTSAHTPNQWLNSALTAEDEASSDPGERLADPGGRHPVADHRKQQRSL